MKEIPLKFKNWSCLQFYERNPFKIFAFNYIGKIPYEKSTFRLILKKSYQQVVFEFSYPDSQVHSGYSCSGGSWANLSISSEHILLLSIVIIAQLIILIWASISSWAFLSVHNFPPEHFFFSHEPNNLNIFVQMSISIWASFWSWAIINNAFPLWPPFKINHPRSWIEEVKVYSIGCTLY